MKAAFILALAIACIVLSSCSRSAAHYVEAGNRFFADKNYEEAALQYRKALLQDPKFAEGQYRVGLVEIERGNTQEALAALTRATELNPQHLEAKIKLADLCVTLMLVARVQPPVLYNRIVALSDEFLRNDPNSFDGLRLKGYVAALDKKPNEAIEYFRRALQLRPDDVTVAVALAETLSKDGQAAKAESVALEAVAKNKAYAAAYDFLYKHYLASNRLPAAETILRQKAANNPNESSYLIQLATHLHNVRKEPEMAAVLQKLLGNSKDFPSSRMIVGDFYVTIRRFDEADRLFRAGLSNESGRRIDYLKRISNVQQNQDKREDALRTVEEILKLQPDDQDSLGLQASLLRKSERQSDRDRAIEIFRGLVKRDPKKSMWWFGLGRGLLDRGNDLNAARNALQEALRTDTSLDLARHLLADIALRQNRPADALAIADEVLARKPRDGQAYLLRIVSLRSMKKFAEARRELRALEVMFPNTHELRLQAAVLTLAEGKHREAGELFQKLYQAQPSDFRPLQGLVDTRFAQDQIGEAVRLLEAEVKKAPDAIRLRLLLAAAAMQAGDYYLATQQYQHLLRIDPKSIGLYISLGNAQLKLGQPEKALETFQRAKNVDPNNQALTKALAVAFEDAGRLPEAIQQHRRSLQLNPEDAVVQNDLAYLLAETGGDMDEALRLIQQAVRKMPDHAGVADTLGWVYLRRNMTESAQQVFTALVKKEPRNPIFQYHLGAVLSARGDKNGARNALKTALANKPPASAEKKIRELLAQLG